MRIINKLVDGDFILMDSTRFISTFEPGESILKTATPSFAVNFIVRSLSKSQKNHHKRKIRIIAQDNKKSILAVEAVLL